jgi:hypothetical protein
VSRATLIAAAKAIGHPSVFYGRTQSGKSMQRNKSPDELRIGLFIALYGPHLGNIPGSASVLDRKIDIGVMCKAGKLGYLLSMSQYALRNGNEARGELLRILELKRRNKAKELLLVEEAKQCFALCKTYQALHEVSPGLIPGPVVEVTNE